MKLVLSLLVATLILHLVACQDFNFNLTKSGQLVETTTPFDSWGDEVSEECYINRAWSRDEDCDYVKSNQDNCEGGGYLKWTKFAKCQASKATEVVVIVFAVIFLLMLFITISTAADDYFSPNVAVVVSYLRISESVAGVTFMAFGNGSPDIFGSIASVLSTPKPKAGLALGLLLGGAVFVTLIVPAAIILAKPFKVGAFSSLRDLLFFIVTLGWILFTFLYSKEVYIWEPAVCLGIYALYVCTVICLQQVKKRTRSHLQRNLTITASTKSRAITNTENSEKDQTTTVANVYSEVKKAMRPNVDDTGMNAYSNPACSDTDSFKSSISDLEKSENDTERILDDDEHDDDDFLVVHNIVGHTNDGQTHTLRVSSDSDLPVYTAHLPLWKRILMDIYLYLHPFRGSDWHESNILKKIFFLIKLVPVFFFKLTIPLAEMPWCKSIAIMHAIISPQWLVFAIHAYVYRIANWGPFLFVWLFVISAVLVALIVIFTNYDNEPRFYKICYALAGFVMAISWIYIVANEVVSIVTMLGVVLRLSNEVLGLTVLAWCNSIGDVISDVAVAKQGYPRMAMAAALGGPLFNLLIGFGFPFLIAKAQGKSVPISLTPTYKLLLLFLAIGNITTLAAFVIQRFRLRRPQAFFMIGIYVVFLIMVILTETKVAVWN